VEDGTRLAYDVSRGLVPEPDPDLHAEMYERACERMSRSGYAQYEISNWARPGGECRHNLVYWRNGEWLGLGPGAHSHWGGHRFATVYSPRRYIDLLRRAEPANGDGAHDLLTSMPHLTLVEEQPPELQAADTAILALRLNEGLDLAEFKQRFGRRFTELYAGPYEEMVAASLLERVNGTVRLTDKGRFLANEVFVRLLPD
jgi:oxygen-independent coproporphyrinogen-3 oxidase